MRTRSQAWAQDAYEKVRRRAVEGKAEYKDMALRFPILVRQAGLSQALAFVDSRGKEAHKDLGNDLAQTLGYKNLRELVEMACKAELLSYMHLTRDVLTVAAWYKRFAEALIVEED